MKSFSTLMTEALRYNRERINNLSAFEAIIFATNLLVADYEKEEGIDRISTAYPTYGGDYLLITIYLSKKGKIVKDVGLFLEAFVEKTGCVYTAAVTTSVNDQTRTWSLTSKKISYSYLDIICNPRIKVTVDATKASSCKQVATGEMVPVYEFVCDEE